MLKKYYPNQHVHSVFDIDFQKLYDLGYRGILFDVDNTLVHHGDDSNEKINSLFKEIKEIGLKTILVSDNNEERLLRFLKNIDSPYIAEANKPNPQNYIKALEILGITNHQAICIGDQVFKDILGANNSNIDSILVDFIKVSDNEKIGKRRYVEKIILQFYKHNKKFNSIGDIKKEVYEIPRKRKQFCEIHPICYKIATKKEIARRHLKNFTGKEKFAKEKSQEKLPIVVYSFRSNMIKRAPGVDLTTQFNKATNIELAAKKINNIIIHPGEIFSFWKAVGKTSKKNGYTEGRVIINGKLTTGVGGGLCNLGNSLNLMVLHSPLTVTEFHKHSDSLAPDEGKRKPLSAGTAVSYNYVDYRFSNNTEQDFQILIWCDGEDLCGELRTNKELSNSYSLIEEERHYAKENDKFYNNSKIYRVVTNCETEEQIEKELIWDNHSEVMFDYSLIPEELIKK